MKKKLLACVFILSALASFSSMGAAMSDDTKDLQNFNSGRDEFNPFSPIVEDFCEKSNNVLTEFKEGLQEIEERFTSGPVSDPFVGWSNCISRLREMSSALTDTLHNVYDEKFKALDNMNKVFADQMSALCNDTLSSLDAISQKDGE